MQQFLIKKNGFYLSALGPVAFRTTDPSCSYRYTVKQVAIDVARKLKAHVQPIYWKR